MFSLEKMEGSNTTNVYYIYFTNNGKYTPFARVFFPRVEEWTFNPARNPPRSTVYFLIAIKFRIYREAGCTEWIGVKSNSVIAIADTRTPNRPTLRLLVLLLPVTAPFHAPGPVFALISASKLIKSRGCCPD